MIHHFSTRGPYSNWNAQSREAKQGDTRCEQGEEAKTCKCSSARDGTRDQKLPAYGLSSLEFANYIMYI